MEGDRQENGRRSINLHFAAMKKILLATVILAMASCKTTSPVVTEPKPVKKIYRLTGTDKDGKIIHFGNF